jgi:hypothetical protein
MIHILAHENGSRIHHRGIFAHIYGAPNLGSTLSTARKVSIGDEFQVQLWLLIHHPRQLLLFA